MSRSVKLLLATTNQKKLTELRELLAGLPFDVVCLSELPSCREVEETGASFEENASLKALGYANQAGMLTLGEDSGLCCDALEGAPGVHSARFAGEERNDEQNNKKLLRLLSKVPDNCRGAHYASVIAVALPDKILGMARGEVYGAIAKEMRGTNGFGYDPLFYYPAFGKTFGEVPGEMKNRVSHRSKALLRAKDILQNCVGRL